LDDKKREGDGYGFARGGGGKKRGGGGEKSAKRIRKFIRPRRVTGRLILRERRVLRERYKKRGKGEGKGGRSRPTIRTRKGVRRGNGKTAKEEYENLIRLQLAIKKKKGEHR